MGEWREVARRICKDCGASREVNPNFTSNFFNPGPCGSCGNYRFTVRYSTQRSVYAPKLTNPLSWLFPETEIKSSYDMDPTR